MQNILSRWHWFRCSVSIERNCNLEFSLLWDCDLEFHLSSATCRWICLAPVQSSSPIEEPAVELVTFYDNADVMKMSQFAEQNMVGAATSLIGKLLWWWKFWIFFERNMVGAATSLLMEQNFERAPMHRKTCSSGGFPWTIIYEHTTVTGNPNTITYQPTLSLDLFWEIDLCSASKAFKTFCSFSMRASLTSSSSSRLVLSYWAGE